MIIINYFLTWPSKKKMSKNLFRAINKNDYSDIQQPMPTDFNWDVREGDYKSISEVRKDVDYLSIKRRKRISFFFIVLLVTISVTYLIVHFSANI